MSNEKKIVFGTPIIEPNDVMITGIHVDSRSHMVTFVSEKTDLSVKRTVVTMEECQNLGIINLDKLKPFLR